MIITNKHFGKIKKTLQTNIAVNGLYDTKLCGSVLCYNRSLQCCFEVFIHLPRFLLLLSVSAYIYISQGHVETHLLCAGIYKITLLQIVCRVRP